MRYQRTVGYVHVFTSEEREAVVSGANLAVGNMHVPADDAVDPVVVGKQQAVQDVYARDHGPPAIAEVKCPVGSIPKRHISYHDVVAVEEDDHGPRTPAGLSLHWPIARFQHR